MKPAAVVWCIGVCLGLGMLGGCVSPNKRAAQPEKAAELNLELGVDYLRKGNLPQAKEKIERSLEQNPRNAKAHTVAGMLYDRLNDPDKADSHYQRAVALDAENPDLKNNYAAYLCQKGKYERGEKLALEAAQNPLYQTPEIGFLNAGTCARNAGDVKRAEESFRRALAVKPRFGEALLQMADLQYKQTDYLSARAFLERYLAVGRTTPTTLLLGHRIEQSLGNTAQARHYAERLKTEYPSAAQTKELLESERNPG